MFAPSKSVSSVVDTRYLPQPLRATLDTSMNNNGSIGKPLGCLDSSVVYKRGDPASGINGGGFRNTSSFHLDTSTASNLSSASFSPIAQLSFSSAARFPLQAPPTCELQLNQWINHPPTTQNSPVQHIQHLASSSPVHQQPIHSSQFVNVSAGLPSSVGTTATSSSFHSASSGVATSNTNTSDYDYDYISSSDIYGSSPAQTQAPNSASLPASSFNIDFPVSIQQTSNSAWPSSAPVTNMDYHAQMMLINSLRQQQQVTAPSPTFYSGFAGLGIQGGAHQSPMREDISTVSPKDVMASGTVVDADDFNQPSSYRGAGIVTGGDFPVLSGSFSPEAMYRGIESSNLFGSASGSGTGFSAPSPPEFSTQFQLDMEDEDGTGSNMNLLAMESSTATVRPRAVIGNGNGRLGLMTMMAMKEESSSFPSSWDGPASAPAAMVDHFGRQRPSLHTAFGGDHDQAYVQPKVEFASPSPQLLMTAAMDDDEEEEAEDGDDGDDDYVDGSIPRGVAGPHRGAAFRRHSSSTTRPKRGSPYSRPRPAGSSSSGASSPVKRSPATPSGEKKVKAVKWESTKPKYWVPEGFDPWYDQKSRGRGVETVGDHDAGVSVGDFVMDWPRDYLPPDWKEQIRGKANPSRPFVCPAVNCGKTFQRSEHAKRHAGSLHTPDAVKVPCPYPGCDHKSTRGDNLKQHMDSHRRKKTGGNDTMFLGSAADEKDRTIRQPRRGSGAARPRRRAKNEDEDYF